MTCYCPYESSSWDLQSQRLGSYRTATKDYSVPGNDAKNLFKTKFDQEIRTATKDYLVLDNDAKNLIRPKI